MLYTLFLGASFAPLEVEMADHVVDNPFPPLKGNDDPIMLVATLELIRTHQQLHLLLVQDLNWVRGAFKPPHW